MFKVARAFSPSLAVLRQRRPKADISKSEAFFGGVSHFMVGHQHQCYNCIMPAHAELHTAAAGQVVSNPGILGGRPVFAGTRVPVATLFEYLGDGLSLDYFLESFPSVSRDQATGVIRYSLSQIERELA